MGLRNVDNPTEPKPYGNAETREPVWRETVDSATYGESRRGSRTPSKRSEYTTTPASCRKRKTGERTTMNDAALLDSLHAALRNPDLAWYTEFHAGESIVAGYPIPDGPVTTMPYRFPRAGSAARSSPVKATTPFHGWSTGTNTSIHHHIDWNGKGSRHATCTAHRTSPA